MAIITAEPFGGAEARALSAKYYGELSTRIADFSIDARFAASTTDLLAPNGLFLIAHVDEMTAGCAGLRRLDSETGEIKHMWVVPEFRGKGLGRELLRALEDAAREMGCSRVVLDTSANLPEAIGLYEASGYLAIASYNNNPHAQRWFERRLGDSPDRS